MKLKKLTLSRETIKSIDGHDLENAPGGITPTDVTARCSACTRVCSECCGPITFIIC